MARDYSGEDSRILQAISSFDGVPGAQPLSDILPYSKTFIFTRIRANPELQTAIDKRGEEYVRGLSDEQLAQQVASNGWASSLSAGHRQLVYARVDTEILEVIQSFDGVPNPTVLRGFLPYGIPLISDRVKANPELQTAIDKRGEEYINGLSDEQLAQKIAHHGWVPSLSAKTQQLVYQRTDQQILGAIQLFDGVPTANSLRNCIPYNRTFISSRIKANPELQTAMDKRGEEYINGLSDEQLVEKIASGCWMPGLSAKTQQLVYQRTDERILEAIQSFDGLPTAQSLSRSLPYSVVFIWTRLKANAGLQTAIDKRGEEYINGLSDGQLAEKIALKWWLSSLSAGHQKLVYQIVDTKILRTIQSFDGIPSSRTLSNILPYGKNFILNRVSTNPMLWQAYYKKRGLTPDQAVELALERENNSVAAKLSLVERLENLHAFREILGVIRCFQDLFRGAQRIIEFSLYPSPVSRAGEVLGSRFNLFLYSSLREDQLATKVQDVDLVVVQGLHRHQDINALLAQIKSIAQLNAGIILTYSTDYTIQDTFEESLERAGFSIKEQGMIEIEAPSVEQLLKAGVSDEDLSKVRAKVRGQSNILILTNERASDQINVPSLVKVPNSNQGKPLVMNNAIEINTPRPVLEALGVKFIPELVSYPSEPLLVDVVDGRIPVAVIGYDMNPRSPRRLEVDVYPGASGTDTLRGFARRLSRMRGPRRDYGIRPGQHGRIQLQRIR